MKKVFENLSKSEISRARMCYRLVMLVWSLRSKLNHTLSSSVSMSDHPKLFKKKQKH